MNNLEKNTMYTNYLITGVSFDKNGYKKMQFRAVNGSNNYVAVSTEPSTEKYGECGCKNVACNCSCAGEKDCGCPYLEAVT